MLRGVLENIGDDPHRRGRRIDVGVAHHELFEDVVLDGAGELFGRNALLLCGDDVERKDRKNRAVHRHRHAHLVERDAVEEDAHVLDRVDGYAGHADVTGHPGMIRVVSTMRRQVERDGEPFLPRCKVASIKRIALLSGREAGVLSDGPRPLDVHRGVRTSKERRQPWHRLQVRDDIEVVGRIDPLDVDALRGGPDRIGFVAGQRPPVGCWRRRSCGVEIELRKIRKLAHGSTPTESSTLPMMRSTSAPMYTKSLAPASRSSAARSPGRPATRTTGHPACLRAVTVGSSMVS